MPISLPSAIRPGGCLKALWQGLIKSLITFKEEKAEEAEASEEKAEVKEEKAEEAEASEEKAGQAEAPEKKA